jgi:hypothetical protein
MTISKDRAQALAIEHVRQLDLRGYRYEFAGISFDENWPDEWGAIFDVYTPGGHLMDGPVIFVVEKKTGIVRGFEPR